MIKYCTLYILLCATYGTVFGQSVPRLPDDAYASILTILPGDQMYAAFGHTAIRIRADSLGIDAVYNFGTFDFNTEWFYLKFARGLLDYRLARNRFEDVLGAYTNEERPIIEQRLNLTREQRQLLILRLEQAYLPENRYYRYDFFFDNCSTRPRDVLESALGNRPLAAEQAREETFRDLIDPYISARPWTDFGINILLGTLTDRHATERESLFLPDELMFALDSLESRSGPVVSQTDTLFWPRGYSRPSGSVWFGPTLLLWIVLGIVVYASFSSLHSHRVLRYFDVTLFGLAGVAGIVILFLWFGTLHTVTGQNWNLLWAVPTHLVAALFIALGHSSRSLRAYYWLSALLAASLLAGWFVLDQSFHLSVIPLALLIILRASYQARMSTIHT